MINTKRVVVAGLTFAALSVSASETTWTAGHFDMPESAIYDEARERIVVSVIGGHPGIADGVGGLALISPIGDILDADWTIGLDAPKGMGIIGDTLLVADLTRLHEIDLATGDIVQSHEVDGAVFLNDITSDGDRAFVSDFMSHSIWLYEDGAMTPWLEDATLRHPNGVLLDGDRLLVGSWGVGMHDDFTTDVPGSLLSVDLETREIGVVAKEVGNIDGITKINDDILVNDWITGELFLITTMGETEPVGSFAPGLADIASYGDTLFLPSMLDGTVSAKFYP